MVRGNARAGSEPAGERSAAWPLVTPTGRSAACKAWLRRKLAGAARSRSSSYWKNSFTLSFQLFDWGLCLSSFSVASRSRSSAF